MENVYTGFSVSGVGGGSLGADRGGAEEDGECQSAGHDGFVVGGLLLSTADYLDWPHGHALATRRRPGRGGGEGVVVEEAGRGRHISFCLFVLNKLSILVRETGEEKRVCWLYYVYRVQRMRTRQWQGDMCEGNCMAPLFSFLFRILD